MNDLWSGQVNQKHFEVQNSEIQALIELQFVIPFLDNSTESRLAPKLVKRGPDENDKCENSF